MKNSPPTIVTGVDPDKPVTVIVFDSTVVETATPDCGKNGDGFVDTLNVAVAEPTFNVIVAVALATIGAVMRTQMVWLFAIVALVVVKVAVHPIEYWPPVTLTGTAPFIPEITTVFEVR